MGEHTSCVKDVQCHRSHHMPADFMLLAAQVDVAALTAASRGFFSCCSPAVPVLGPLLGPATEVKYSVRVGSTLATGDAIQYDLKVTELATPNEAGSPPVVFLHGFLGAADDWLPVMAALQAAGRRCLAVDLPAHANSGVCGFGVHRPLDSYSAENVVNALAQLLKRLCPVPCDLVGYSLGGRLALLLAARHPDVVARCAVIGASPGLRGGLARAQRAAVDDARAAALLRLGRRGFVEHWYSQPMWASLLRHPRFQAVTARRQQGREDEEEENRAVAALAAAMSGLSVGRQPSVWDDLPHMAAPLLVPTVKQPLPASPKLQQRPILCSSTVKSQLGLGLCFLKSHRTVASLHALPAISLH